MKKNRLTRLHLDEVSLVPSGDDPMAEVVIAKSDPDKTHTHASEAPTLTEVNPTGADTMPEQDDLELDLTDVTPEVRDYILALEDTIITSGLADEIINGTDEVASEYEALADEDAEVLAVAKADPFLGPIIAKAERAEAEAAQARAEAEAERNLRLEREFISKAESLPMLAADAGTLAGILTDLSKIDPALAAEVEGLLTAANAAITKGSLFAEFGTDASPLGGTDVAEIKAQEILKTNPGMTPEQAMVQALEADPSLYNSLHTEG